jgi:transposase-like protein
MRAKAMEASHSREARAAACPRCGSRKTVLRGFRHGAAASKQLYLCRSCGRKFTPDNGYLRMRFSPQEIQEALSLIKKGYSLAEARTRLQRRGIRVSRWTIAKWARKYASHKQHSV